MGELSVQILSVIIFGVVSNLIYSAISDLISKKHKKSNGIIIFAKNKREENTISIDISPTENQNAENISQAARNVNELKLSIYANLTTNFNLAELEGLGFDLGINYDNLPSDTKQQKAMELVNFLERHGRLDELVTLIKLNRPNLQL